MFSVCCQSLTDCKFGKVIDNDDLIESFYYRIYIFFGTCSFLLEEQVERFDESTRSYTECRTELRFLESRFQFFFLECPRIPVKITCQQRTIGSGLEGLHILLKRLPIDIVTWLHALGKTQVTFI